MKKSFYRITAAALMTTMLAASVVGCSKSSSGGSAATAGTETADPGKQTTGTADASGDLNPLTPPEGVQLKEDLAMGLKSKHTTIDTMEAGFPLMISCCSFRMPQSFPGPPCSSA